MFKRVERKRKRREEDEELGLDQDTREATGLNNTYYDQSDSEESPSGEESESGPDADEDMDQEGEENAASREDDTDEEPPLSVAEVLKYPIYLISLNPTVHGCVLCKGKFIKNTRMAEAHKNANAHKRRLEQFRTLSSHADPCTGARELVRMIRSASRTTKSQELSKRALRRQVKQTTILEKRKRHKELKAKAIAKKTSQKLSGVNEKRPAIPSMIDLRSSPQSKVQPIKFRKKKKLGNTIPTSMATETRKVTAKLT